MSKPELHYHASQNIQSALDTWMMRDWIEATKYFKKKGGGFYTWRELKLLFYQMAHPENPEDAEEWAALEPCDRFDVKEGCLGHPAKEQDVKPTAPSKEWMEKMIKLEEGCEEIGAGSLTIEKGPPAESKFLKEPEELKAEDAPKEARQAEENCMTHHQFANAAWIFGGLISAVLFMWLLWIRSTLPDYKNADNRGCGCKKSGDNGPAPANRPPPPVLPPKASKEDVFKWPEAISAAHAIALQKQNGIVDVEHNEPDYFDEDAALAEMLKEGPLFSNTRFHSMNKDGKSEGETIVLYVNCNDIFEWACADTEDLAGDEIEKLYRMWKADKKWGTAKWCAIKRNLKPQKPCIDLMKIDGSWDDAMEKLGENKQ